MTLIDNLSFQDDNDDDIPLATYANVVDDEGFWQDLSEEQANE